MTARTHWVTPTLLVGTPPPAVTCTPVTTMAEALGVIDAGGVAVFPAGAWDAARETLTRLGLPPDVAEDRVHYARTTAIRLRR